MKKQIYAAVLGGMLVLGSVVPAFAQDTQGSITLTGAPLSFTPAVISFTGFQLDGTAHDDIAGTTTAWTAKDPTGTGAGWRVTIAATDFVNGNSKTIAVGGFEMTLLDEDITTLDGNGAPASAFATAKALGAAQTLVSAAVDEGMGTYTLEPTFTLDVPANTYAGTFVSTVTVAITAAPE